MCVCDTPKEVFMYLLSRKFKEDHMSGRVTYLSFLSLLSCLSSSRSLVNFPLTSPRPNLHPGPSRVPSFAEEPRRPSREARKKGLPGWLSLIAGRRKTSVMSRLVSSRLVSSRLTHELTRVDAATTNCNGWVNPFFHSFSLSLHLSSFALLPSYRSTR